MKLNLFGLSRRDDWKEIKSVLHQIWQFNQKPPYFPECCDTEFQRCFKYVKKKYGLNYLKKKFELQ